MGRPPSIQWYYKQWLGDNKVLAMEWDARGMHHWLLMLSVQEEPPGSIPDDDAAIRRWLMLSPNDSGCCQRGSDRRESGYGCRCPDCVWRRVRPQIMSAWSLRDGRWFNSGMEATFERKETYKARDGTKLVPDRYEKDLKISKEEVEDLKPSVTKKIIEPHLAEIWKAYPRKVSKPEAFKAITRALRRLLDGQDTPGYLFSSMDDAVVYMLQRVRLYAGSPAGQAGEFTPHPATWFNQARYLDDDSEWSKKGDGQNRRNTEARPDLTAQANPDCDHCKGSGYRASYSTHGKREVCECTEANSWWRSRAVGGGN